MSYDGTWHRDEWHRELVAQFYADEWRAKVSGRLPYYGPWGTDPSPHAFGSCRCVYRGFITVLEQTRDRETFGAWDAAGRPEFPLGQEKDPADIRTFFQKAQGYMNSTRKTRRCLPGMQHRRKTEPRWRTDECRNCGDVVGDYALCGTVNCGDLCDYAYERTAVARTGWPRRDDDSVQRELVSDRGICDWCLEKYRREDGHRDVMQQRAAEESRYWRGVQERQRERDAAQEERVKQWQLAKAARTERTRQRQLLREGHQTLTAIRRHLRAPAQSPLRESRPAKTSPTS